MAFDDLARRMREAHGGKLGDTSQTTDPEQIVDGAVKADRRANIARDLVLGPLLLLGAIAVTALTHHTASQRAGVFVACGPAIVGAIKLMRGLARLGG